MLTIIKKVYLSFHENKHKAYFNQLIERGLHIGRDVNIMDGVFIDPTHCYLISLGDNCTLATNTRLIAHDASAKKHIGYTKIGKIRIENNCFLGDSAIILPGVTIGENSIIGAGSIVTKDIPAGSIAVGNPCRKIDTIENFTQKRTNELHDRKSPYAESDQNTLLISQRIEVLEFLDNGAGYIR